MQNPRKAGCRQNITFAQSNRAALALLFDGIACVATRHSLAQPPLNLLALQTFA